MNNLLPDDISLDEAELHNEIERLNTFISIAAHEIRNSITSLLLKSQIRVKAIDSFDREQRNELIKAQFVDDLRQLKTLVGLVDIVLSSSRGKLGDVCLKKEEIELKSFILEIVHDLKPAIDFGGCEVRVVGQTVFGCWDKIRLGQVVTNLVMNAVRYGKCKPVSIEVHDHGDHAEFEVIDSGIGIRPNDKDMIFKMFCQGKNLTSSTGVGLGLFVVKEIINAHRGDISFLSKEGSGSVFRVRLPK